MKAIVYTDYGSPDVLHIKEVEKPTPKDNEVLVKIHAAHINFGDTLARNFKRITPRTFSMPMPLWIMTRILMGIRKPNRQILGSEFSGVVESIGKDVTSFKPGDAVFGYRAMNFGTNAEYVCMAEGSLILGLPSNMSYEEAAATPYGALTALNLVRRMNIQPGQKVLINGASGSIGSYAVQLAKHFGAEVTGVCGTGRMEMVKSLGTDYVIDYSKEDFTKNGKTYDVIFDVLNKGSFAKFKNSLTPTGKYFLASFKFKQLFQMLWTSFGKGKKVICALSSEKHDDLVHIRELAESGTIKTIVDKTYPMEQAAEAHWYLESGKHKGNVVLTMVSS